jgi:GH25 family lysozyme M1 (1,4-beta-N-acetylmuramidase)
MEKIKEFFCGLWLDTKKRIILLTVCGALFLALVLLVVLAFLPSEEALPAEGGIETKEELKSGETAKEEVISPVTLPDFSEPVNETLPETTEQELLKKEVLAKGIDVSKWQGKIDWARVKAAGIEFAMVRLGYKENGACFEDDNAAWNLKEAEKNGVLTGVYFYSGATTPQEAREEAEWVLGKIGIYAISYPVVFDYEIKSSASAEFRTDIALSFLNRIKTEGYEAMLYVALKELEDSSMWQQNRILSEHLVWGARYLENFERSPFYPETEIRLAMWQYSNQGRVEGISGDVDLNAAYIQRTYSPPKAPDSTEASEPDDFRQNFQTCQKEVTAKSEVNLRKTPSMDGEIIGTLKNGEYLVCTGESDMGWSRLEKDGEKFYAVTSYLISSSGETKTPDEVFTDCCDTVTAKVEVNLRLAPSTNAEIAGVLQNPTPILRTGIGDKGWSRLDFGGTTVYAVTSYLQLAE